MLPQNQEITMGQCQQTLANLKRRMAQTQGEANQILADTSSQTMDSILNMLQQAFSIIAKKNSEIESMDKELERCYNAYPELKIINSDEKKNA